MHKDFNGVEIKIGQKVIILQTPIFREHEFLLGEVIALTSKQIQIKTFVESSKYSWDVGDKLFKRYPEQVIVV